MRFTPSAPGPALRPSRPRLTQFLCYHNVRSTPTAHTTNALHALLHSHSYTMQIHQHMTTICVGTHRLLQILNYATLATLHAMQLMSVFAQTLTPARSGMLSPDPRPRRCPRTTPHRYSATDANRSVSHIHPANGAPPHAYANNTPYYYYATMICLGTHQLLIILVSTAILLSLCLAASLFPTPTPTLLTRTGYATGEFQSFSTERHAPREATATHAHRSPHHVTPPQVDERAITPNTSDATTPPLFRAPSTGGSLAHESLNVGGPDITPNRLCHLLNGFTTAPHTISLQEFKPTTKHHIKEYERVAMFPKYHLLYSAPTTKNGVALLVHTSISPTPRTLTVHIPGTLISTQLQLHPNPLMPPLRIASYYGPHSIREKRECEPVLNSLLREACIILGDYNSTTYHSHATTLTTNLWPWLIAKERSGALSDLLIPFTNTTPYTRERRFAGTKSYIECAYGTRLYQASYRPTSAEVVNFSGVHGASDHDPIITRSIPWTTPYIPEPRCAQWHRRDTHRFRFLMEQSYHTLQTPTCYHDVQSCYQALVQTTLHAMRTPNSAKPTPQTKPSDVSDWHQVVKQLTRQAKKSSKVFYRRIKHTLLTPPAPSTLLVPSQKIERILQRNSPWSARAAGLITPKPLLHDPPPPSVAELRALAKSSRKKSPGPHGLPPYLLTILPDNAFSVLHNCLTLCYEAGDIPHCWLVSETLCIFKGKVSWRDPDRWRPIAMSNSVYRLLMRWVYKRLYPLISPQLHPRQFGGRQGVSTVHAKPTFLDDIDGGNRWEAIFFFDMYHAFDGPPKILSREVLQRIGTPTKLLLLISTVLEHGSTFIRGTPDEIFGMTHGVKQGCPLSCFLFVIVFEIPLGYIHSHNIILSAYVDDISTPVAYNDGPKIASVVQAGLNLIGCQLNVIKSEFLPVHPHCPPPPVLPK